MATSPESCTNRDSIDFETSLSLSSSNPTDTANAESSQDLTSSDAVQESDSSHDSNLIDTEKPLYNNNNNRYSTDEIPEQIKVLDDIISEFEESAKPVVNNGENQSEDDGYMSLSRKNMPKKDGDEISIPATNCVPLSSETSKSSFLELDRAPVRTDDCVQNGLSKPKETISDPNIIQATLPKARTNSAISTNYSSLPCCGVRLGSQENKIRTGSCSGERNMLGIDISAVHNAVLRGRCAQLPEPIINEHPVTIYPGRYSPPNDNIRGNRPQRLLTSVEKHKELCQILHPSSTNSSTSSSNSTTGISTFNSVHTTNTSKIKEAVEIICKVKSANNKYNTASEDESSEESVEGQCAANQLTPSKKNSIAWEIHFNSNKKKYTNRRSSRSELVALNNGSTGQASHSELMQVAINKNSRGRYSEDYNDQLHADKLNYYACSQSNMLGKGTFVIRKSSKKMPNAIDIFCAPENDTDYHFPIEHDLNHSKVSVVKKCDNLNSYSGLGGIDLENDQCSLLKTSKNRLSLNIDSEPKKHNSLNKEVVVLIHGYGPVSTEGLTKVNKSEHARENENLESIKPKVVNVKDDSKKSFTNDVEICTTVAFKNDSNGLKSQDFPDLRPISTTPHTDLAPTLEEDEEQYNDFGYNCAPLQQIESNISALLRGEISVIRAGEVSQPKRSLEFRPGVHKSESAKEMLLSQNVFGPLPPSPPSSNPDFFDYDALPPLPPSPKEVIIEEQILKPYMKSTSAEIHTQSLRDERRIRDNSSTLRYLTDDLPLPPPTFDNFPPAVPPHRGYSSNTMKSWSIDSNYKKKTPKMMGYGSGITTPTGSHAPSYEGACSAKRYVNYGTKRSLKQSPREEHRLQTSCSLPETPIFARGCDIPRTPFRRPTENTVSGSRTAPRSTTSHSINMGNSIVGIAGGGNTYGAGGMCRQRSINHALASNEMLRLSGVPARGWYPKQRSMRPVSTENIHRLTSTRVWDSATGISGTGHTRKPLTLPPNLTPSFLNKSPREALRRVTSLLITRKKNPKERKNKAYSENTLEKPTDLNISTFSKDSLKTPNNNAAAAAAAAAAPKSQKKKGLFKSIWKRTKHVSLDQ